jgi:hypothetical protein
MANNLKAAAEAMRKLGPKKKFEVVFEQSSTNCINVEAVDEEDANDQAWEIINNGGGNWGNRDTDIVNTTEV